MAIGLSRWLLCEYRVDVIFKDIQIAQLGISSIRDCQVSYGLTILRQVSIASTELARLFRSIPIALQAV
jgi:hypothetical protein